MSFEKTIWENCKNTFPNNKIEIILLGEGLAVASVKCHFSIFFKTRLWMCRDSQKMNFADHNLRSAEIGKMVN